MLRWWSTVYLRLIRLCVFRLNHFLCGFLQSYSAKLLSLTHSWNILIFSLLLSENTAKLKQTLNGVSNSRRQMPATGLFRGMSCIKHYKDGRVLGHMLWLFFSFSPAPAIGWLSTNHPRTIFCPRLPGKDLKRLLWSQQGSRRLPVFIWRDSLVQRNRSDLKQLHIHLLLLFLFQVRNNSLFVFAYSEL